MVNKNFGNHVPYATDRIFTAPQLMPPGEFLLADLSVDGLGVTTAMNVNGSVTPVSYKYIVPTGKTLLLHTFAIHAVDAKSRWPQFMGITALTNGLVPTIYTAGDVALIAMNPIKTTAALAHFGGGATDLQQGGAAQDSMYAKMDIHEITGFVLYLTAGQYIETVVQDDLTGISHLEAVLTGRLLNDPLLY